MVDFKRQIQNLDYEGGKKKIMIITAFERMDNENMKGLSEQGRPMIMIYHLDEEFDKKPKIVHELFLNNVEYANSNFAHPNIFT